MYIHDYMHALKLCILMKFNVGLDIPISSSKFIHIRTQSILLIQRYELHQIIEIVMCLCCAVYAPHCWIVITIKIIVMTFSILYCSAMLLWLYVYDLTQVMDFQWRIGINSNKLYVGERCFFALVIKKLLPSNISKIF